MAVKLYYSLAPLAKRVQRPTLLPKVARLWSIMTILGLHYQSGLLLAASTLSEKYTQGVTQTPMKLTEDVFCVCATHPRQQDKLRLFIENIRMACDQQHFTPVLVGKVIQQKLMQQADLQCYIQFILGGIDRTLNQITLYSVINGTFLEYSTYCVGAYEGHCKNIQGYIDSKYSGGMLRKEAIALAQQILTVNTTNLLIDVMTIEMDDPKPIRAWSIFKNELTIKHRSDLMETQTKNSRKTMESLKKKSDGTNQSSEEVVTSDSDNTDMF
ncbi:hypothetical protein WDU94_012688 [Cyamophila willieti]